MFAPEKRVAAMRASGVVEMGAERAMPELGAFVATGVDAALRASGVVCDGALLEGRQGVRADVPPGLDYEEAATLSTSRAMISTAGRPAVEVVLMIPREECLLAAV